MENQGIDGDIIQIYIRLIER